MRLKEFLIFILIFTIIYIIFFLIYDYINNLRANKKNKERTNSLIQINDYYNFAKFYGMNSTITKEIIMIIYDDLKQLNQIYISSSAKQYNLTINEFIVIVLYLEYLNLLGKKSISIENDSINKLSVSEESMIFKYNDLIKNKSSIEMFISAYGNNVLNDLFYIDKFLLVPGMRLIDSKIYYVGG